MMQRDIAVPRHLVAEVIPAIALAVEELRLAHRTQWLKMFKPFGWEVLDIRYGGVINRLNTASVRVLAFADKEINRIEELSMSGRHSAPSIDLTIEESAGAYHYYRMASPNVFFHVMNPF